MIGVIRFVFAIIWFALALGAAVLRFYGSTRSMVELYQKPKILKHLEAEVCS